MYCRTCFEAILEGGAGRCPECRQWVCASQLTAPRVVTALIQKFRVRCRNRACQRVVTLGELDPITQRCEGCQHGHGLKANITCSPSNKARICPNSGCSEMLFGNEHLRHEEMCLYRRVLCLYGCGWCGKAINFQEHITNCSALACSEKMSCSSASADSGRCIGLVSSARTTTSAL